MGGNAFEGTVRLTRAEHARLRDIVMAALQSDHLARMLHIVASAELLDKSSFGDVDLYAACRPGFDRDALIHLVAATVLHSPAPPVRNGRTVSFLTPERYQVDIGFATDASQLAMYATVHSNGDFARLLQVSLTPLGLSLTTEGLFLANNKSFLLSADPAKVGAFLGLPPEAFDGRTSLAMARAFDLVVENRFFDGAAMAAWAGGNRDGARRPRPMIAAFCEWWRATGISRYGNRTRRVDCSKNDEEAWVGLFDERERFQEWKEKEGTSMARGKECKRLLNFALIRSWYPQFSSALIGEALRTIRDEHGQFGSIELRDWLQGLSPEELLNEVGAVASRSRKAGIIKACEHQGRRAVSHCG